MCSVKLICIKRSSLYNGCGHPLDSQNPQFHYIYLFITVNKLANFNMCAPQQREKWMLAKSSNQPFHGNRMGELQTLNELHIQLNLKETCIYIYIYIYIAVTHFSRVTVINRFDCTQHFPATWLKRGQSSVINIETIIRKKCCWHSYCYTNFLKTIFYHKFHFSVLLWSFLNKQRNKKISRTAL